MMACQRGNFKQLEACLVANDFSPPQVYLLPYRLAARYPKTRIGRLATYTDHSRKLDLCDDYVVHNNEFFFDRDPKIFHNIYNFYRCDQIAYIHKTSLFLVDATLLF